MSLQILSFTSTTCSPCKAMKPILEELKRNCSIVELNIESTSADLLKRYNVTAVPTLVFLKNNTVLSRTVGFTSKNILLDLITKYK